MQLFRLIENILFASDAPVAFLKLCKIAHASAEEVESALSALKEEYNQERGGLVLVEHEEAYLFATNPDCADTIAQLRKEEPMGELTRPALETLSVIAYRGPVTKPEIEQIRGVNCSVSLRNLLMAGLIEETDETGGERTYSVSIDFLRHLGVSGLSHLPEYQRLHSLLVTGKSTEEPLPALKI